MTVAFDAAVVLAELSGKRLPTEGEFARAALQREPNFVDSEDNAVESARGAARVGFPSEDRTNTVPAVIGLCSNVAEWTVSKCTKQRSEESPFLLEPRERIVCGGDWQSTFGESPSTTIHQANSRVAVSEEAVRPGLGFRCVRSVAPRFVDE